MLEKSGVPGACELLLLLLLLEHDAMQIAAANSPIVTVTFDP